MGLPRCVGLALQQHCIVTFVGDHSTCIGYTSIGYHRLQSRVQVACYKQHAVSGHPAAKACDWITTLDQIALIYCWIVKILPAPTDNTGTLLFILIPWTGLCSRCTGAYTETSRESERINVRPTRSSSCSKMRVAYYSVLPLVRREPGALWSLWGSSLCGSRLWSIRSVAVVCPWGFSVARLWPAGYRSQTLGRQTD